MKIEDLYNLMRQSTWVGSAPFKDGLIVSDLTISHPDYPRTSCEIKDGVCYASAGCIKDGKPQEGNVNQCINLAKLPHNGQFIVDEIFEYRTDAYGRVCYAKADLGGRKILRTDPGDQNSARAQAKGKKETDQGGHIIARCLGGPNEAINIIPQDKNINVSLSNLESLISSLMYLGWSIFLEVKIEYSDINSFRPTKFKYTVKGSKEGHNGIHVELNIVNSNEL